VIGAGVKDDGRGVYTSESDRSRLYESGISDSSVTGAGVTGVGMTGAAVTGSGACCLQELE